MNENLTPIEIIAAALDIHGTDILVPEQCLIVYIDDVAYHLTLEPMPDESYGCADGSGAYADTCKNI